MSEKKKKLSGYQNLMHKRKREEELEKHVKITHFFSKPESTLPNINNNNNTAESQYTEPVLETSISSRQETDLESKPSTSSSSADNEKSTPSKITRTENMSQLSKDAALWPKKLRPNNIQELVERGPAHYQNKKDIYPRDSSESGRKFSNSYFFRILPNKEKIERFWLLYSETKNSLYCFCCKIFNDSDLKSVRLSDESGYNDWQHLSEHLNIHEKSKLHIENVLKLLDLSNRLNKNEIIDSEIQNVINRETKYWQAVIERIFYVIQFLGEQNLAFRGSSNKLFEKNNGNFLKCIEMISKFDPIMSEHTKRSQIKDHKNYLGDKIQNEVINLIGENIKSKILEVTKKAKYYSILLDCTPDSSHQEQISVCIRFVNLKNTGISIEEHFLLFCPIDDVSGEGLRKFLLSALEKEGLNINDMRGQGYDNGANMRGRHNGLQKKILDLNPRAFFVPCCNHSLNLVVNDAAKSNTLSINFFSLVQELFVFFSASTKRWSILKSNLSNVTNLTLKPLSDTRWSSRIDAITPLRYQLGEVYDALFEISEGNFENNVKNLAASLAKKLQNFEFICILILWYNILSKVNIVSKIIQKPNFDVAQCYNHLNNLNNFLKAYRSDKGFNDLLIDAKEIASSLDIEPTFKKQRGLKPRKIKKKHFDYECDDEPIQDETLKFKVDCFFNALDVIITSVDERFKLLSSYSNNFAFLWNIDKFKNYSENEQLELCQKVENLLNDKTRNERDITAVELVKELQYLQNFDEKVITSPEETLNYITINNLADSFPNTSIILRILLTMPVSVATAERSFSKLKIIKNYLRSTMGQNRLSNLAIISIESDQLKELDTEDLIKQFAKIKARKAQFT